ncbi:MAG: OmpA family protein [Panacagrimonas sp.]
MTSLKNIFAVSALALTAGSVHAFDEQKYVGAMGLAYFADSSVDVRDGAGARFFLGVPLDPRLNIELNAFGYGAEPQDDTLSYFKQQGGGLDLMAPLARGSVTPFLLFGGGFNRLERGPEGRSNNGYANAGVGALFDLGSGWAVRAEGRYVALFPEGSANIEDGHLDDAVAGLGLQYTFQKPVVAPPPPPPPPAPPPPPPPPPDTDGDGVIDTLDQCPNTPAGVQVDARGCPLDGDGDGVPDYLDKCPNTTRGLKVDATGCVREAQTIVLQNVNFEYDKDTLTAGARTVLTEVARGLVSQADLKVEISGHTDSKGSNAYNQKLSDRRASSVKAYLISQSVAPGQLVSKGYGEIKPIAGNDTDTGRAQNRRVEFRVLTQSTAEPAAKTVVRPKPRPRPAP